MIEFDEYNTTSVEFDATKFGIFEITRHSTSAVPYKIPFEIFKQRKIKGKRKKAWEEKRINFI